MCGGSFYFFQISIIFYGAFPKLLSKTKILIKPSCLSYSLAKSRFAKFLTGIALSLNQNTPCKMQEKFDLQLL